MKQTILILFLFFSAILSGQDVYVDLNKLFNGNGTQENPLNDLPGELLANTTYWVKAGTEKKVKNSIRVKAPNPNITIRKWGGGVTTEDNPLFWSDIGDFKILDVHEHHLTIDGINFHGSGVGQAFVVALGSHLTIKNVKAWGFYSPVRVYGHFWNHPYVNYPEAADQKVIIENCEFFEAATDGIFIKECDNITVRNCYIHNINLDFFEHGTSGGGYDAPGDCIQLEFGVANYLIENNYLDRRNTGNKFCFIANGSKDLQGTKIIRNNTMIPPPDKGAGGAGIYVSGDLTGLVIENNVIIHPEGEKVSSIYGTGYNYSVINNRIYNPGGFSFKAHVNIDGNEFYGTTRPTEPGEENSLIRISTPYNYNEETNKSFAVYDSASIQYPVAWHSSVKVPDFTVPVDTTDNGNDPGEEPTPDPCEGCPDTIYVTQTDTIYVTDTTECPPCDDNVVYVPVEIDYNRIQQMINDISVDPVDYDLILNKFIEALKSGELKLELPLEFNNN